MKKSIVILTLIALVFLAWLPVANVAMGHPIGWLHEGVIVALNLIGWSFLTHTLLMQREMKKNVENLAFDLGVDVRFESLESLLLKVLHEVERKNSSLSRTL